MIDEFDRLLGDRRVVIILPRMKPIRELIPSDILRWIQRQDIYELRNLAHIHGHTQLSELTSLILSEELDIQSLL